MNHLLRSLGLDVVLGGSKEEQQLRDSDNFASLCTLGLALQERDVVGPQASQPSCSKENISQPATFLLPPQFGLTAPCLLQDHKISQQGKGLPVLHRPVASFD